MSRFYFTYGSASEAQPFKGGWTLVIADNMRQAIEAFQIYHPNHNGCINCAFIYPESDFEETETFRNGNFGIKCWETIQITCTPANSKGEQK